MLVCVGFIRLIFKCRHHQPFIMSQFVYLLFHHLNHLKSPKSNDHEQFVLWVLWFCNIAGLSASGSIIIEENDFSMCMSLLLLTVQENGGCTLSSVNKDLPCYLNNATDPMSGEVHLLDGTFVAIYSKMRFQ